MYVLKPKKGGDIMIDFVEGHKRRSILSTNKELQAMKKACKTARLPMNYDKDAGTLEVYTPDSNWTLLRAIQKSTNGPWIVTMVENLFQ